MRPDRELAERISVLADMIWHECYASVLPQGQIDYMLRTYHSAEAMMREMSEGYEFFIVTDGGRDVGYYSVHDEGNRLYVSKVYLLKECRGKGLGKRMFGEIDAYAEEHGLSEEYLRVNKGNPTVGIYRKSGFSVTDTVTSDIGNGYVMDDYVMTKRL